MIVSFGSAMKMLAWRLPRVALRKSGEANWPLAPGEAAWAGGTSGGFPGVGPLFLGTAAVSVSSDGVTSHLLAWWRRLPAGRSPGATARLRSPFRRPVGTAALAEVHGP